MASSPDSTLLSRLARRAASQPAVKRAFLALPEDVRDRIRLATGVAGARSPRLSSGSGPEASGGAGGLRALFARGRTGRGDGRTPNSRTFQREDLLAQLARQTPAEAPGPDAPRVSAVVLTRDGLDHLQRLLPALERTPWPALEVIVLDQASTDGSRAWLADFGRTTSLDLTVVENPVNDSFSVGNNRLVREHVTGEFVLLLNNDVEPAHDDWLAHLVATARETWDGRPVGAVGARLVYPERPDDPLLEQTAAPAWSMQHGGIRFDHLADGTTRARNDQLGEDPTSDDAVAVRASAAATAACLLLPRAAWDAVGGLDEAYEWGTEDVDLCLRLRQAGFEVVQDGRACLFHHEFGTQGGDLSDEKRRRRERNRERYLSTWDRHVAEQLRASILAGDGVWTRRRLTIAITVTRADPAYGWGDIWTALELRRALWRLGADVVFKERYADRWYEDWDGIDAVVNLLDAFDVRHVPGHVVRLAWIRNWSSRWLAHDHLEDHDVLLASSQTIVDRVREHTGREAVLFPLATNPDHWEARRRPDDERDLDVAFVGSRFNRPRAIEQVWARLAQGRRTALHGHGWDSSPTLRGLADEPVHNDDIPRLYGRARFVLDDSAEHTLVDRSVNTRVFDALAAGALPISNDPDGLAELGIVLPTWTPEDPEGLAATLDDLAGDDAERQRLLETAREVVLTEHTYDHRASHLLDLVHTAMRADRWSILIGVPSFGQAGEWGDFHYARGLQRGLAGPDRLVRLAFLPQWREALGRQTSTAVHLFGLSPYTVPDHQRAALWILSHPELVEELDLDQYDLVLSASERFADRLRGSTTARVETMLQGADLVAMSRNEPPVEHPLLVVANSRLQRRSCVEVPAAAGLPFDLHGERWSRSLLPAGTEARPLIPYAELARHYRGAEAVVNDHWPDMRELGFVANRIFDVLAAGGICLTDDVPGLPEDVAEHVLVWSDPDSLRAAVESLRSDPAAAAARREAGRAAVHANHGLSHRAARLVTLFDTELTPNQ